jgi:putative PEP-CTERM system histidine kinase
LSVLIAIQAQKRANLSLAICCAVTAAWAASTAAWTNSPMSGPVGVLDLLRLLTWYLYLLFLYRRLEIAHVWQIRSFYSVAASAAVAGLIVAFSDQELLPYTIYSPSILIRLALSVSELLLIENLYLNSPESARWHIALPCVLLGGLACFDILVVADTALFHRQSMSLASGRTISMIIVAPLLVLAASRGQRWSKPIRLSRAAVFHSATLVLSGSVLLSLAFTGEVLRHVDDTWGWVAELSLVFSGLIGILLFVSSQSAKSLLKRVVVYHFFADRYDYRAEWLRCIETLSGRNRIELTDLHIRAIQAIANVVNSPSGMLFIKQPGSETINWVCSWNTPSTANFASSDALISVMISEQNVVDLSGEGTRFLDCEPLRHLDSMWLAIPLMHSNGMIGIVIVGPPRTLFRTDQEVFDLLTILGQEVGTYIAEQQATEVVFQTRGLHDYGKRFAFVAHDIKNVSSQLALLLSNAERHLNNPEFQRDMLGTVRSSVQKIDRLLRRLDEPSTGIEAATVAPVARLEALLSAHSSGQHVRLKVDPDAAMTWIAIGPDAFDAAITHLLNNAIEASPERPVTISFGQKGARLIIEISDQGDGMSPEFIRDELFSPFKTRRVGGSGIGAFQARELITEAGGNLSVISEKGVGTTMRVVFTRAEKADPSPLPARYLLNATGESSG